MTMLYQIVRKEILENLMSLRFTFSLILTISLFAVSSFVFVDSHREQLDDYWKKMNENLLGFREQSDHLYKLAFYEQNSYRKPKLLTLCAGGFEESLPSRFVFNAFSMSLPQLAGQSNFTLPRFTDLDWAYIVSLIFSFIALVFAYDSICGEKEKGTLRLMLAGTTPRATILLGKYLGLMLTLGISLLLGILVNLVIVVTLRIDIIGPAVWMKIISIVVLSFLYLSIFVFLGLFVSTRTARSSISMAALLLIWVVLIILIPSLGRVCSDRLIHSPDVEEFDRAKSEAIRRVDDDMSAGKFGERAGARTSNIKECNPPARARYANAGADAMNRVIEELHNRMVAQAIVGRNLTCISPAVIYQRASEAIAGVGINHCVNLFQQIKQYQVQLKDYIRDRDREDPDSLHLLFDEENSVAEWNAISKRSVSFDSVPKFQERDLALGRSLKLAIWDIGLLVLFNLVFFTASFVSFLRYDVR
jgi:ABC-type transport system involved in multi-copper enzyme maturation permease subunit